MVRGTGNASPPGWNLDSAMLVINTYEAGSVAQASLGLCEESRIVSARFSLEGILYQTSTEMVSCPVGKEWHGPYRSIYVSGNLSSPR